jgi:pimeloyl-ACP methyl ester carboxylesterase
MSEEIDHDRRRLLGAAVLTVAAAEVGTIGSANAQPAKISSIKPGTNTSFKSLKQIDAGLLNVGYAEAGPANGPAVILLHGWPYDIYSFVDVAPLLASAGYRVIVPYLRGYGTTRFLSNETFRNGQPSAVAVDIVALMDALKIPKATLGGFDWGARTVNIMAALWPERCKATVSVSGYLIGSQEAGKMPLPPKAELEWWYQFYFTTERGRAGYDKYRHDFAKLIWQLASPKWNFDDETFDRSAASFDNPDHVAIVIHNYRWRLALAEGEPKYADLDRRLAEGPVITVPTITMEGDANGAPHLDPSAYAKKFSGKYTHRTITGSAAGLCAGGRRRRRRLIVANGSRAREIRSCRKKFMEGMHHESEPGPARRSGRLRNRGSVRDPSRGKKQGAANDSRTGSITHRR